MLLRKKYKKLGVTKNYAHSCSADIDKAIKKTRRKGGMILPWDLIGRK